MRLLAKRNPLKRLYRISFGTALMLSLPFFLMVGWMVTDAALEYRRFVGKVLIKESAPSLNGAILHELLNKNLRRAFHAATAPDMPVNDAIPVLQMQIDPENLATLNDNLPESGKERYHRAYVKYKGKSYTVKTRYRGGGHWHWLTPQKSWRIKTKKKKLLEGLRKVNIVNPKTILSFDEAFSMQLANEIGLMAPNCSMVKFVLNNEYKGLYYFWEQVDESLLRRNKRMPGSIYSDIDGGIWKREESWKKVASRNAEEKMFRGDIALLITALNKYDLYQYKEFADQYFNKDQYALYLAFDNITGTFHHDFYHNFKIYFDSVLGKFEFIPWDQHLWNAPPRVKFEMANPPLNKWKLIPQFDLIRQKILWELLTHSLQQEKVQSLLDAYYHDIKSALQSDKYRDAINGSNIRYVLKLDDIWVDHFSMADFENEYQRYKKLINTRYHFLLRYLSGDKLSVFLENDKTLQIVASGNVGNCVNTVTFTGKGNQLSLYKDTNRDGALDKNDVLIDSCQVVDDLCTVTLNMSFFPGYRSEERKIQKGMYGPDEYVPSGIQYPFILSGDVQIESLEVDAENIVTGKQTDVVLREDVDTSVSSTSSLHPWDLPEVPEREEKVIGPGIVIVSEDQVYPKNVHLKIAPGTTIRLVGGASIFCYGKVTALGTADQPIRFLPLDREKPWGVFALQGDGADGSTLSWCSWERGSVDARHLVKYSGMVSLHGVDNVIIRNCRIGRNYIGDDALHLAYCNNFSINESVFEAARSDAVDIDISSGKVVTSFFSGSGNDSLDFMTSDVVVSDCYFHGSRDKGISIGEMSQVTVNNSVFEECDKGLEIKDQSVVHLGDVFIIQSKLAINLYKKNWRYESGGKLVADTFYTYDCSEILQQDKNSEAIFSDISRSPDGFKGWRDIKRNAGKDVPLIIQ